MCTNKIFFCVLSNFVEIWCSCSTHGYYNFTKFQQNWIKHKKVFICAQLTEVSSVKVLLSTKWIRPWSIVWDRSGSLPSCLVEIENFYEFCKWSNLPIERQQLIQKMQCGMWILIFYDHGMSILAHMSLPDHSRLWNPILFSNLFKS